MTIAFRWEMTAPIQPLVKTSFEPAPADHEVVVEVAGCGVCHSDLGYFYDSVRTTHPLPLTLGHEISGRVVRTGGKASDWIGKAVLLPAVFTCGQCELCKSGQATICRVQKMLGNDIHGGFASHIVVPAYGLCTVDEQRLNAAGLALPDISVVADAVTTPYQAVLQAGVKPNTLAVVIGLGGVGGYCAQIAKAFGATVVGFDVDPAKLQNLAPYCLNLSINAREVSAKDIKKMIGAFAAERRLPATGWFIFECSGTAAGQSLAWNLLTYGATLGVVGFTMDKVEVRLSSLMAFHARALGNWGCPADRYPAALDLVLDGRVKVLPFIEKRNLADINSVFDAVHRGEVKRRIVLVPDGRQK